MTQNFNFNRCRHCLASPRISRIWRSARDFNSDRTVTESHFAPLSTFPATLRIHTSGILLPRAASGPLAHAFPILFSWRPAPVPTLAMRLARADRLCRSSSKFLKSGPSRRHPLSDGLVDRRSDARSARPVSVAWRPPSQQRRMASRAHRRTEILLSKPASDL